MLPIKAQLFYILEIMPSFEKTDFFNVILSVRTVTLLVKEGIKNVKEGIKNVEEGIKNVPKVRSG